MKITLKTLSVLSGAAFFTLTSLSAVETDPVGYVTTTTPNGDDALIGLPLTQPPAFTGAASGVSGAVVSVTSTLVADAYNNTHYLLATSGANAGQWSEVIDSTTDSFTTAEALLATNDTFKIIPFWTLATAFVDGEGIGAVGDPFNPSVTVSLNNLNASGINLSPAASYFYFIDGPQGDAWYQTGSFALSDDVRLSPEAYIIIRNNSTSELSTVVAGTVPTNPSGTTVVGVAGAAQDNQLVNPYPAGITLAGSGLVDVVASAVDPFNPVDTVSIFDGENQTGQNLSPPRSYFYFLAGPSGDGWYQTGSFAFSNDVVIPAGGAFIVRKGAGNDETLAWNPPLPYSL
jgi:uncharacterized protein (TIGR02597 family)